MNVCFREAKEAERRALFAKFRDREIIRSCRTTANWMGPRPGAKKGVPFASARQRAGPWPRRRRVASRLGRVAVARRFRWPHSLRQVVKQRSGLTQVRGIAPF